jgi:hypothetical protein
MVHSSSPSTQKLNTNFLHRHVVLHSPKESPSSALKDFSPANEGSYVLPKHWLTSTCLHGATPQKTVASSTTFTGKAHTDLHSTDVFFAEVLQWKNNLIICTVQLLKKQNHLLEQKAHTDTEQ